MDDDDWDALGETSFQLLSALGALGVLLGAGAVFGGDRLSGPPARQMVVLTLIFVGFAALGLLLLHALAVMRTFSARFHLKPDVHLTRGRRSLSIASLSIVLAILTGGVAGVTAALDTPSSRPVLLVQRTAELGARGVPSGTGTLAVRVQFRDLKRSELVRVSTKAGGVEVAAAAIRADDTGEVEHSFLVEHVSDDLLVEVHATSDHKSCAGTAGPSAEIMIVCSPPR